MHAADPNPAPLIRRLAWSYLRRQRRGGPMAIGDLEAAGWEGWLRMRSVPASARFSWHVAEVAIARAMRRELERWIPYYNECRLARYRAYARHARSERPGAAQLEDELRVADSLRWLPLTDPGVDPPQEQRAELALWCDRVRGALEAITPERTRRWAWAYLWDGLQLSDIASSSGVTPTRVGQVLRPVLAAHPQLHQAREVLGTVGLT